MLGQFIFVERMEIDDIVFTSPVQFGSPHFESYLGKIGEYTVRIDRVTAPLDTDAKVQAFHAYCSFLKKMH